MLETREGAGDSFIFVPLGKPEAAPLRQQPSINISTGEIQEKIMRDDNFLRGFTCIQYPMMNMDGLVLFG